MRSQWGYAWFLVSASALFACTLTAEDFAPGRLDPEADGQSDPSSGIASQVPPAPEGCRVDCAASSSDGASDSEFSGPASSESGAAPGSPPGSPSDETGSAPLPLDGAASTSDGSSSAASDATPNDGVDPAGPPLVNAPPPVPSEPVAPEQPGVVVPPVNVPPVNVPPRNDVLLGWAAVEGLGIPTTTGGAAGATVRATTAPELAVFAALPVPLTIEVSGTIRLGRVVVASNKTLRGVGVAPRLEGGLRIRGQADDFVQNVIVQNLQIDAAFSDVNGNGIQIHYAHHVWVDHCEVSNAQDGNLDVVHGSDFVTVSWNRFSYPGVFTGSRRSTQIGHSDNGAAEDAGHLRVTLHHNAWLDGVLGAMPSVRFGDVHVFNNYYASPSGDAAISATVGSRLLVENNYFDNVATPYQIDADAIPAPQLRALSNVFTAPEPRLAEAGAAFVPPYTYVSEAAESVPELVLAGAGATLSIAATP